ncbi:MAG: imidazole glycerol phosphate synthase subunit HisH [Planctomycetes bacterium]|nr:imidazole glycerol phosphate synthase subunit HisH [Planctomycetota bacterium]
MESVPFTLVDYGVGNLHSLAKAFENAGAPVSIETDLAKIVSARCLLLPGVGAFAKVAAQLAPARAELRAELEAGRPAFAVCIGMQVLYESSEEGAGEGIGFFEGPVRRLAHPRLPHIGWNSVTHDGTGPFRSLAPDPFLYFVHSFAPGTVGAVATADYGGPFGAAAVRGNTWAVQFHPEKSGATGLRIIRNFVEFASVRA